MPRNLVIENRSAGPRYLAAVPVRAEWDDEEGRHFVAEGETENVGPEGALVHLPRELPDVGSRVNLEVIGEEGTQLKVIMEVLRLERNAGHPLAALQLLDAVDEWRGLVWEPAAPQVSRPADGEDDEDEDDGLTN
ncbi:MAG: hypothetical protein AUG51_22925 [Acidobacteria bacterium 13_1_20CM_3_53_8]|nr:MAG: hypothetical protein AUG51_22925 [Acidobacteria bacterium 13_1_20CM_3_53_8]